MSNAARHLLGFLPGAGGGMYPETRHSVASKGFPSLKRVTLHWAISPRAKEVRQRHVHLRQRNPGGRRDLAVEQLAELLRVFEDGAACT